MEPDIIGLDSLAQRILGGTFSSLGHRNYRLYFLGQVVSNTGNWLTNIALTLLVLKLTHSGLAVGVLAACQYGPVLLLSIWGGAVADRSDKRRLLLLTQSLEMAESVGLAVLAFMPHTPLSGLFILAIFGGVFLSLDNPLRRSFVSEMVPKKDISNAVVIYSSLVNISRIVGPLLAGLLVVTVGYGWCFSIDAVSYLAVLASLLLMKPQELFRHNPRARSKGEVRAGLLYVLSKPILWISLLMLLIVGIISYNFSVTLPLFVIKGLHKSNATYTIIYSAMSTGSLAAALLIARRNLVRLKHTIIGAAALGVGMLFLAISPSVIIAVIICIFVGAASILYTTSTTALVQLEATPNMRGRVLALQSVLLIGTTPIGAPLLGWIADSFGGRAPLIIGGIGSMMAAGVGYGLSKKYKNARVTDQVVSA